MEPKQIKVLFFSIPLNVPLAHISPTLFDDPILATAIQAYSKELWQTDQIETFKLDRNMIITEDGYKVALTEEQVEEINNA